MKVSSRLVAAILLLATVIDARPQSGPGMRPLDAPRTLELRGDYLSESAIVRKLGDSRGLVLTEEAIGFVINSAAPVAAPDFRAMVYRLPVIEVIVSPVPPRDFVVKINGRDYPASEESKYGVRPGPVDLEVRRGEAPPCAHKLVVTKDTMVRCAF